MLKNIKESLFVLLDIYKMKVNLNQIAKKSQKK